MTPPPLPSNHPRDHSQDYYYFVVAIAIIALLLLASNLAVVGCCSTCSLYEAIKRCFRSLGLLSGSREQEDDLHISQLIPVSKFKKEQAASDSDCTVCLLPFVEGEEVRQLPKCKHSFHAPCIDMWLYSHSNCPICRADVLQLPVGLRAEPRAAVGVEEAGQSRRSMIETGSMTGVVVSVL